MVHAERKALANASAFLSEIQSEMHFVREILLRNVKYACGVWIYFISLLISKFASANYFTLKPQIKHAFGVFFYV